jgi:hypothetical protein
MSEPTPFTQDEINAMREWHARKRYAKTPECRQGDPWPCRTARFLATLDAKGIFDPAAIAKFYGDWNERLEAAATEAIEWLESGRTDRAEGDAATASALRGARG